MLEALLAAVSLLLGFVLGQVFRRKADDREVMRVQAMAANISLDVARQTRDEMAERNQGELDQRRSSIEQTVRGLQEQLSLLQRYSQELEAKRERSYGGLVEQLTQLQAATNELSGQSRQLSTALKGSHQTRGRWGEVQLKNIVELAGMTEHISFEQQVSTGDGARPDMLVKLPGGDAIPVDAKVPLTAYLSGLEAEDQEQRKQHMLAHAKALRDHVRDLERRGYHERVDGRINFTVLFVPGDPILAAAFEADPALQTDAMEKHILIATPVTLLALLRTVGIYWQQAAMADNAHKVWETTREFRKRVGTFQEHLAKMGKGLSSAVDNFNKAMGSYERNVLSQGRKVEALEDPTHAQEKLGDVVPLEKAVREIAGGSTSADTTDTGDATETAAD